MANSIKPLLLFPSSSTASRDSLDPFIGNIHSPSKPRLIEKYEGRMSNLERVLNSQTTYLGADVSNFVPEMILVLEVAGRLQDFYRAAAATNEIIFIGEFQTESEPDEDFYKVNKSDEATDSLITTRVFLTMTNQTALRELQILWSEFKKEREVQVYPFGTAKFRTLFQMLKDIRPYNVSDRLADTGFSDYIEDLRMMGITEINFEIELAFRNRSTEDDRAFREIETILTRDGGAILPNTRTVIAEIGYHALIAKAPISVFNDLTNNTSVAFLRCQQVLSFRPVGQSVFTHVTDETVENISREVQQINPINQVPIIALLDGMPMANHSFLRGHLNIDDPDDVAVKYLSNQRIHGTAMSSLIINGDLTKNESPLNRLIYVRLVLEPAQNGYNGENLPSDKLSLDVIHGAVKRMFDPNPEEIPAASEIKIINLSVGDPYRPFLGNLSPLAKLIDWLSYKYNVLFLVSAGNKPDDIAIRIPNSQFENRSSTQIERLH